MIRPSRTALVLVEQGQYEQGVLPWSLQPPHDDAVTGPGEPFQRGHICNDAGTDAIEMDVADQLQEVGVFLTEKRLVAVLEEMPGAPVSSVELLGVAGQYPSHDGCKGNTTASEQKMRVILEEHPCVTGRGGLAQNERKTGDEVLMILRISEDRGSFNAPDDDMVDGSGCIDAALSRHTVCLHGMGRMSTC